MPNVKNNEKRKTASVNRLAHARLKELSKRSGIKLERLIDDAVFEFLKRTIINSHQ